MSYTINPSEVGAMFWYYPGSHFTVEGIRCRSTNEVFGDSNFADPIDVRDLEERLSFEIRRKLNPDFNERISFLSPHHINYEIFPTVFICRHCSSPRQVPEINRIQTILNKCPVCGNNRWLQSSVIFVCDCGRIEEIPILKHHNQPMRIYKRDSRDMRTWRYKCNSCNHTEPFENICTCGQRMRPKPTDSSGVTSPLSESFIMFETPNYHDFLQHFNIPDNLFEYDVPNRDILQKIGFQTRTNNLLNELCPEDELTRWVIQNQFFEYFASMIHKSEPKISLRNSGFIEVYHVDGIQLITTVYGRTIAGRSPDTIIQTGNGYHLFRSEERIQALTKAIETDGLLLKFSPEKVLKWLSIEPSTSENINQAFVRILTDDLDARLKFLRSLHTISHSLIRSISLYSGIDPINIREKVFHFIPAILLINNSCSTLGGLRALFDNRLEQWFHQSIRELMSCINDPSCQTNERGANCIACTIVNEQSCEYWNDLLDRNSVIPPNGLLAGGIN